LQFYNKTALLILERKAFRFKEFSVFHDKCAMKVGTDAVLLGAWTNASDAKHILDIGTGTGIISLMLAQQCNASIDVIDIDESAFRQAQENIENSPWKNRINATHSSLQDYCIHKTKEYDIIVSNPPYFIDSSKAAEESRTNARHTDKLSFQDLLNGVACLLSKSGKFYTILPVNEGEILIKMASLQGLHLSKMTEVIPRENKPTKRLLMQFEFIQKPIEKTSIIIEENERHQYTEAYKNLTKDYYLAF
jgi:tRNA1Val (adenine37-N6)-methyltransferase